MQIRIPLATTSGDLDIDPNTIIEVQHCIVVDTVGVKASGFVVVQEHIDPKLFQRTLYFKGPKESIYLGSLVLDLEQKRYLLRVVEQLERPDMLAIQLTLKPTKEQP